MVFTEQTWPLIAGAVRTLPGWSAVQAEADLGEVVVVSGGLTNLLFKLTWAPSCHAGEGEAPAHEKHLLVRLYGELDGIIEREREVGVERPRS